MKKIAVLQTDLGIGGIQKSCVNFLNNLDLKNKEVDLYLFTKEGNVFINDLKEGINVYYLNKLPYITKLIPFNILRLFYKSKVNSVYDVVIDYNSYANETSLQAINIKSKKKIMLIHNDMIIKRKEEFLYRILYFMFKSKYKYFDTFWAVSEGSLNSFKKLQKLDNKTYEVIPNIIDTLNIKNNLKEKNNIKIDKNKINICSNGRIVHQKGYDLLIREINNIKDKLTNHHFYIIGDGNKRKQIESLIKDNNLNDLITIVGYLKNPYPLMNEMDAFVLMSRYEGQGMVFLEAKALDLNVIMPAYLEKYVDGIKGTDNIGTSLLNIKKKDKKFNDLKSYNDDIIKKINNL